MRIAYVNGSYVPYHQAVVPMEDRGYQFADGIYEVMMFYGRRFLDWDLHLERLHRSLDALNIPAPMSDKALALVARELLARNPYPDGYLYLQITRGAAQRSHTYNNPLSPFLTLSVMPPKKAAPHAYTQGVKVITLPDERWGRCDIKSIALLPNILALQQAMQAGAAEAFLYDTNQCLTEGTRSTAYIVKDGAVHTHPESHAVLPGVRKIIIRRLCQLLDIPYCERHIPMPEVLAADEAFLTSATSHVLPVMRIDDTMIGDGAAGTVTTQLLHAYRQHVTQQTGKLWD